MADAEFDIQQLADHLHLSAAQVQRMAERGQIPARRIQGAWRFHPTEIHHWWESQIGTADVTQLDQLENVLRGPRSLKVKHQFRIAELIPVEAIELNLAAKTSSAVLPALSQVMLRTGLVWDADRLVEAWRAREELHSTAMENGVALIHARRPQVSILGDAFIGFARTASGIPFGNNRGQLTDLFFVLCMLDDRSHLQVLARLSRLLLEPGLIHDLRCIERAEDVITLIADIEERVVTAAASSSPS